MDKEDFPFRDEVGSLNLGCDRRILMYQVSREVIGEIGSFCSMQPSVG